MKELSAEDQAKKAILHVLRYIQENPKAAYLIGHGSKSWALLTEAAATLWCLPLEEVRENMKPEKYEKA